MQKSKANLRALIVEDDQQMLELLCRGLRDFGHTPMPASDGDTGFELAMLFEFDVIVLDVGLPKRDGYEIAGTLRRKGKGVPILMLTARDAEDDIIRGLECGADDYLLKPFSFAELVARMLTLSRARTKPIDQRGLLLDSARLAVSREARSIQLTRTEFLLLAILQQHAGIAVPRQTLIEAIWQQQQPARGNALDVLVNGLRGKIDGPFPHKMIETVRGVGYRLRLQSETALERDRESVQTLSLNPVLEEEWIV